MSASITVAGLGPLIGRMSRTATLQKEMVAVLHDAATPIRRDMDAAAHTRIQSRAMDSVDVGKRGDGIELKGGARGGLGAVLFPGGEFGGHSGKKKYVVVPVFGRRATSVRKRTTMMFLPHLGHEGYFFWPTVRDWTPKLTEQLTKTGTEILGGGR